VLADALNYLVDSRNVLILKKNPHGDDTIFEEHDWKIINRHAFTDSHGSGFENN